MPTGWGDDEDERRTEERRPARSEGELPRAPRQFFVPAEGGDQGPPAGDRPPPRRVAAPSRPSGAPGPADRPARPRRRRRWGPRRIALSAVVALLGLFLLFVLFGLWQFQRVDRVAVGSVLSPAGGGGANYLIVGSDSREGFDPNDPNAGAVLGEGADGSGQRSDTMLVLRTSGDGALMTSIPRDLWVTRPDGTEGRINAAYRDGPEALIRTVQQGVGIPVHHYVEVDFVTFAGLVDAVGGVTIDFPHPARDTRSGLDVPTAGPVTLDGTQALAYVRSRHYEELVDGGWRADPTGDLGRVQRQQAFLRAVMSEAGGTRNPIEVARISSALSDGLRIDDSMGFLDALRFANRMRSLDPESVEIPTFPFRTSGGAAVLGLVEPDAAAVISRFQG
ncbi:LCP family protein [Actinomarinicola tropica]|uniref:Cell envelope-related transcriptional attenuator domain-containing protein n=1 Tax=Actinomarinicola tropica TaxID=2789776 RepID=A0A5Q2RPH7_9ACTN|nr:LCP family protein [Actinomarinicola tropica]QGG95115.1 hypothetical protein GH723_08385 [Actinomarinicola tropica]